MHHHTAQDNDRARRVLAHLCDGFFHGAAPEHANPSPRHRHPIRDQHPVWDRHPAGQNPSPMWDRHPAGQHPSTQPLPPAAQHTPTPAPPPPCPHVSEADLPDTFRQLLAHHDHMTTTLARYHGRPVQLRVIAHNTDRRNYRRMITLTPTGAARPVEFGIVRIDLTSTPPEPRAEILDARVPLGDILIRHNVLRRIEPLAFLRVPPDHPFAAPLLTATPDDEPPRAVYGRIGIIHCADRPAIELLEVVTDATA